MKTIWSAGVLLLLMACGGKHAPGEQKTDKPQPPAYTVEMLSSNMDYVCGMELTSDMIADTAQYEGKTYGFCNVGCKDEFKKDPAKYLTQK